MYLRSENRPIIGTFFPFMLIGAALRDLSVGKIDLHHFLSDGTLILKSDLEKKQDCLNCDRKGILSLFKEFDGNIERRST